MYPIQIQADNENAADAVVACMCHVFDGYGKTTVFNALSKQYRHVVAWDKDGKLVDEYDNR